MVPVAGRMFTRVAAREGGHSSRRRASVAYRLTGWDHWNVAFRVLAILLVALVAVLAATGHGDGAIALAAVGVGAALALNAETHPSR